MLPFLNVLFLLSTQQGLRPFFLFFKLFLLKFIQNITYFFTLVISTIHTIVIFWLAFHLITTIGVIIGVFIIIIVAISVEVFVIIISCFANFAVIALFY